MSATCPPAIRNVFVVPIKVKDAEGERVATYVHSMPARAHLEQVGLSCNAQIVSCVTQWQRLNSLPCRTPLSFFHRASTIVAHADETLLRF